MPIAGSLPATIVENTAPWEWAGTLRLLSDPNEVLFMDLIGFGSDWFDATLNAVTGLITVTPFGRLDHEWFVANGHPATVELTLRFFLRDGTQGQGSTTFQVAVQNTDDTPPMTLAFASGGSVRANQPGATVGRLAVTDPDTASGFTFTLSDIYDWQFMVVGDELRLRPGVIVDLTDGPTVPLLITVSDGRNEQSFILPVGVLPDPAVATVPIDVLAIGESRRGFSYVNADYVHSFVPTWQVDAMGRGASGLVRIQSDRSGEIWFGEPRYLDFTNGFVELGGAGNAARMWLIYETVFDRAPRLAEMGAFHDYLTNWAGTEAIIVNWALTGSERAGAFARMTNREFVQDIYRNSVSWDIGAGAIDWHAGRLDQGIVTRAEFVSAIMEWRRGLSDFAAVSEKGFFVPRPGMEAISALFELGVGWGQSDQNWWWWNQGRTGGLGLFDLANGIAAHPNFAARWGWMTSREFVDEFYLQMTGVALPDQVGAALAAQLDAGQGTRANFMGHVAQQITDASEFRQLPTGSAFEWTW